MREARGEHPRAETRSRSTVLRSLARLEPEDLGVHGVQARELHAGQSWKLPGLLDSLHVSHNSEASQRVLSRWVV